MQKNVASQKWVVFAFNRTDNTPLTGDAANITAKLSIDGAAGSASNDTNPTEIEDGYYVFDLTQAETNGDLLLILPESSTSDIQVVGVPGSVYTTPANFPAMGIESDGHAHADVKEWKGAAPADLVDTDKLATQPASLGTQAKADVNAEVDTALVDIHLDHLLAATYDPASKPGAADALLNEVVESDGGVSRFTENALEQAPSALLRSATAQAGATGEITLDASASATDDFYNGMVVAITGGTGVGQARLITDYDGTSKVATVVGDWVTAPDSTSAFKLIPAGRVDIHLVQGNADAASSLLRALQSNVRGKAQTGTLSTTEMTTDLTEATDDHYNGRVIVWTTGALAGQATDITDYDGSTKKLTYTAVTDTPANNDEFIIF